MSFFNFLDKFMPKSETAHPPVRPVIEKDVNGCLIMPKPSVESYRQYAIIGYDGNERIIYASDEEVLFPDGCLITSKTDLKGNITHANEAFVTMSGWTRNEIISQQHNVLRHPDMPAAVFRDMWQTIKSGQKWHGYVKNLRKDSSFYWVYATVIPNIRHDILMGFTSVRRKPSRAKIAETEAQYQILLAEEQKDARIVRVE